MKITGIAKMIRSRILSMVVSCMAGFGYVAPDQFYGGQNGSELDRGYREVSDWFRGHQGAPTEYIMKWFNKQYQSGLIAPFVVS